MLLNQKVHLINKKYLYSHIDYIIIAVSVILLILIRYLYPNYLLFHSIAEIFSIIIAGGIFVIGWNSRKYSESSFFFILGVSFLFVGAIDTIHTLGYSGMGVFQNYGSNLATSLWISARYMQSISILVGLFFINKKINKNIVASLYLIITIILFVLIFSRIFPACYNDTLKSLTLFKIISEYIIIGLLVLSIVFIYRLKNNFDISVLKLIMVFIIFSIASEFAFTLYSDVFGIQNLIGHVFKIIAFYFAYKAIIETGIEKPFKLMFRTIKQNELELKRRATDLEKAYSEAEQIFNASLALLIINKDCDIIKVNDPFCNLLQVNPEEIIGRKCYDIVKHDYCGSEQCCINQIIQDDKKKLEYEIEEMSKNGNVMTLLVNSEPYYSHEGDFIGIIQNYVDISERKRNEIISNQLAAIVDSSSDAIIGKTLDGIITSWNLSAEMMYGYTRDEAIGSSIEIIVPVELLPELYELMENVKDGIKIANFETVRNRKDGSRFPVSLALSPIINEDNNIIGISAIARDITENKLNEKKIKESEEKYRSLIEDSLEGVWVIDLVGNTTLVNSSMARMLGYAKEEILGKSFFEFMDEKYIKIASKKLEDRKKGLGEEHEFEFRHKSGSKIHTMVRTTPIITKDGNIEGAMAFITDETERKVAESRLEKFVSTVSHELRTPITVLMMSIEYLKKTKTGMTSEIEDRLLDGISRNITLLSELVEDILLISQIDEKKLKIDWKAYYPRNIIQDNLKMLESNIKAKNLEIELYIDENIVLFGDLKRINQVFRIFLDNAIKYSKENSKILIQAQNNYIGKYNQENVEGVLFEFTDQGIGIRKKDIQRLFERFFRTEEVRDIPGTGLGLSIAKSMVELHDGQIFVKSEYGKGSTFSLFLPRKKESQT